jgi:hypothetical protein
MTLCCALVLSLGEAQREDGGWLGRDVEGCDDLCACGCGRGRCESESLLAARSLAQIFCVLNILTHAAVATRVILDCAFGLRPRVRLVPRGGSWAECVLAS